MQFLPQPVYSIHLNARLSEMEIWLLIQQCTEFLTQLTLPTKYSLPITSVCSPTCFSPYSQIAPKRREETAGQWLKQRNGGVLLTPQLLEYKIAGKMCCRNMSLWRDVVRVTFNCTPTAVDKDMVMYCCRRNRVHNYCCSLSLPHMQQLMATI